MEEVYRYIDKQMQDAIKDLVRLCRQPSISAQEVGLPEMAQLVTEVMQEYGIAARLLPTAGGPPVVLGELAGDSPNTILFYNHYDVQPPEPLELWSSPPFEPTLYNGKLRGRGVADNKGNIAARLAAIKAYLATHGRLPISIKFCIEGEEEIGSPHLAAFVEENRQSLKANACLWEGGGVTWEGKPTIALGVKGILYVELEAEGALRDVHSSMATVVPNPAWRLTWALNSLKDAGENILIEGFYDDVLLPSSQELEAVAAMPSEEEEMKQSLGLRDFVKGVTGLDFKLRHLFQPTCTICGIASGYIGEGAKTVLPAVAKAKVDFRLVPNQQPEDILVKLRSHLDRRGFNDIAIHSTLWGVKPARTPMDAPFVKIVSEAAREVYQVEPVIMPTMAATGPMYCFTDLLGIPTAASGIEYPDSQMHAPDENIRLADFARGIKHVAAIINRVAATGPLHALKPN